MVARRFQPSCPGRWSRERHSSAASCACWPWPLTAHIRRAVSVRPTRAHRSSTKSSNPSITSTEGTSSNMCSVLAASTGACRGYTRMHPCVAGDLPRRAEAHHRARAQAAAAADGAQVASEHRDALRHAAAGRGRSQPGRRGQALRQLRQRQQQQHRHRCGRVPRAHGVPASAIVCCGGFMPQARDGRALTQSPPSYSRAAPACGCTAAMVR